MPQARLPFHYAEESKSTGMTSVSGLAMYLEVAHAAGLSESASRLIHVKHFGRCVNYSGRSGTLRCLK